MAETVKKTRTAAKPRKAASKANGNGGNPVSQNRAKQHELPHDEVARLAHSYWQQRGGQHGHHMEDWFRAEQELKTLAS